MNLIFTVFDQATILLSECNDVVIDWLCCHQVADDEISDNSAECVVCLSDVRDTLILPCRHLCLCNACADTLRYQANCCPICRLRESIMSVMLQNTFVSHRSAFVSFIAIHLIHSQLNQITFYLLHAPNTTGTLQWNSYLQALNQQCSFKKNKC